jgi:hypothetical protein
MTSFLSGLLSNPFDPGASARHASEAQNTASGLQQQASGYYNQLGNEGSALTSLYNANISPLLSLYGQYGGVGNVLTNPTSANTPSTTAGGAASGTTNSGTGSTASGSNATSVLNPAPSQSAPSANPYQLTGSQQQVLNENLAQVANQQNAATQSYKQSMEQAGITDPRDLAVGEEYISQQYATQKQTLQAQFQNQAQATALSTLGNMLNTISGIGSSGSGQIGQAGQGTSGLYNPAQGQANQLAAQNNAGAAGITSLITGGLTGAFSPTSVLGGLFGGGGSTANNNYVNGVMNGETDVYGNPIGLPGLGL